MTNMTASASIAIPRSTSRSSSYMVLPSLAGPTRREIPQVTSFINLNVAKDHPPKAENLPCGAAGKTDQSAMPRRMLRVPVRRGT